MRSSSAAWGNGEPSFGAAPRFSRRGAIDWRWRLDADEPLANPRHETYCRERVAGKTQRQAMLTAWPDRSHWMPETVNNKACKFGAEHEVKARIARLKSLTAEKATTTHAEVLAGMSETFQVVIARMRGAGGSR